MTPPSDIAMRPSTTSKANLLGRYVNVANGNFTKSQRPRHRFQIQPMQLSSILHCTYLILRCLTSKEAWPGRWASSRPPGWKRCDVIVPAHCSHHFSRSFTRQFKPCDVEGKGTDSVSSSRQFPEFMVAF